MRDLRPPARQEIVVDRVDAGGCEAPPIASFDQLARIGEPVSLDADAVRLRRCGLSVSLAGALVWPDRAL